MSWEDLVFSLVSGTLGSALMLIIWGFVSFSKWRDAKKNPQPTLGELLEFRAWKIVHRSCWGGDGLYRGIVHRWNVLECERDEARNEAKKADLKVRRLEENTAQFYAQRREPSLIQIVQRARPRKISPL